MTGDAVSNLVLGEGESLMSEAEELIYRQITRFLRAEDGTVATHAFTGSASKSNGPKPSYTRSSIVTAQDSRDWHTRNAKSPSCGVWALAVGEVVLANGTVIDDSKSPLAPGKIRAPGHCFIDLRDVDKLELKSLRAKLWHAAMDRGEIPTREPLKDGELNLDGL